jgi:tetratricopeptide (TPR) repeat protein
MDWKASNEPGRLDRARVARTDPIVREIGNLGLPLIRQRKLNGILSALMMQIEDGGDSPEVNRLLLDALREGLRHQVGEHRARAALRAIDAFEKAEAERWAQARVGTLPPIVLTPEEQLGDLMQEGYDLLQDGQRTAACDRWLQAWALVTQMVTPDMRTASAFDKAYPGMVQSLFNWSADLEMELHNAGLGDALYHEHRVRYVNEYLTQFPDEDEDRYVMFRCAEGEALWYLERYAEAESVYQALVERLPDKGWGYIGWSDQYCWGHGPATDFGRAEAILLQALDRPRLEDRVDVLDRLVRLYEKSAPRS